MNISPLVESGKPVDYWFIYKVPQLGEGLNNDSATGYEYIYYDPTLDVNKLGTKKYKSPNRLDQGKGALNLTLDSVFKNPDKTTGWILYNDEMPAVVGHTDDGSKGHTKGVIAFDTASGTAYWLLHSWPKFAEPNAKKDPTPMYGQTYLCISLDIATAGQIAAQMATHQEPQTYLCRTANLKPNDPLYALSTPSQSSPAPGTNVLDLKTLKNKTPFKVIAKNREWNGDFWNGLVGPTLGEDMDVETWIRGKIPPIADTDGIHKTFDIKYINLGPMGAHWAWPESHDHAKWGLTLKNQWVCVGDINRMVSQRKRGGGTIAFQDVTLWNALSKTDLLLAPPGSTRTDAHTIIKQSHTDAETHPKGEAAANTTMPRTKRTAAINALVARGRKAKKA
jgi:deoxyribonuclease-2